MKGLAFALDPDGYWIELVKREEGSQPRAWPAASRAASLHDAEP